MEFIWQRKGLIFNPSNRFDWMQSHAQVPTVLDLGGRYRIYFTCRPKPDSDSKYVSYISFIEVDKYDLKKIVYIHNKAVIDIGEKGCFDHYGTMPGSFINVDGKLYMYYTGWSREVDLPYSTSIGLAVSNNGGISFERIGNGPCLSKSLYDPYLINGPFVIYHNDRFHMWYSSCTYWTQNQDTVDPVYLIKHAISKDGLIWEPLKEYIINCVFENEAQNRPMVFLYNDTYWMIFSYRKGNDFRNEINGYRLGIAFSPDLVKWTRADELLNFNGEAQDWDREMQAYPFVTRLDNKLYLFHNGNQFGKEGFGYSEIEI